MLNMSLTVEGAHIVSGASGDCLLCENAGGGKRMTQSIEDFLKHRPADRTTVEAHKTRLRTDLTFPEVQRHAELSSDRLYRYRLSRIWADGPRATFVMLNPSTADENKDDPTLRRCMGFARQWGLGGLSIVNLYALRATNRFFGPLERHRSRRD